MSIQGTPVILINVYAPCRTTKDQVPFYNNLKNILCDLYSDDKNIICGGDLNVMLNSMLDRSGGSPNFKSGAVENVLNLMDQLNLIDIWRVRNPYLRKYTWRQRNPLIQSRLDYWLISDKLQDIVSDCSISPAINTDHSSIYLNCKSSFSNNHGPSYWKFNDSLCVDDKFICELRKKKDDWLKKYRDILDKRILWELIKFEIRSYTQTYSKEKAKERYDCANNIEKKLKIAEDVLNSNPSDEANTNWEKLKSELNEYYEYVTQGKI